MVANIIVTVVIGVLSLILTKEEKLRFDPTRYKKVSSIEVPQDAFSAWEEIRICSKRNEKKFSNIRWYVAETIPEQFEIQKIKNAITLGVYIYIHNSIILRKEIIDLPVNHPYRKTVIRHELMHVRQYVDGHSTKFFNNKCGTHVI